MRHAVALIGVSLLLSACARDYVQNPDPNHTHADFAVWIDGEKLDFSGAEFMSGGSSEEDHEHLHPYLHLHDEEGGVLHGHKPGIAMHEFFESLGFALSDDCLRLDTGLRVCNSGEKRWRMFLRNPTVGAGWSEVPFDSSAVFADMDQVLLTYGSNDERIAAEKAQMTEDACLYSRTCPWRGEPPTEGCIADPAVPCTEL